MKLISVNLAAGGHKFRPCSTFHLHDMTKFMGTDGDHPRNSAELTLFLKSEEVQSISDGTIWSVATFYTARRHGIHAASFFLIEHKIGQDLKSIGELQKRNRERFVKVGIARTTALIESTEGVVERFLAAIC